MNFTSSILSTPLPDSCFTIPYARSPIPDRRSLERRARLLQVRDLLRRGTATEDCVAMRKAAEALDDREMALCVVEEALVVLALSLRHGARESIEAAHAEALQLDVLGVLQRHVEECAMGRDKAAVEIAVHACGRDAL